MTASNRLLRLAACALLFSSSASAQSVVRQLDSTRVKETDALLVGVANAIVVGPRGNYFISDFKEQHVLQVAPNGSIVKVYGKKGGGPGEFGSPGPIAIFGDTAMLVWDFPLHRFSSFDIRTGKYNFSVPGNYRLPFFAANGTEYLMANPDAKGESAVVSLTAAGTISAPQGALPAFAKKNPMLISMFSIMGIATRGNDVWAVTELSQGLLRWTKGTNTVEEIPLPVEHRKGVSTALYERMLNDPSKAAPFVYEHSVPFAMSLVSPDVLGFITLDPKLVDGRFVGPHYLTLVDVKARRACVDTKLPIPEDPTPRLTFSHDTIVVVQQDTDKNDEPSTAIRRFVIDTKQCKWIPLK